MRNETVKKKDLNSSPFHGSLVWPFLHYQGSAAPKAATRYQASAQGFNLLSKFHGAVEYLPADDVILGSSSFIPKTTQVEREHKSQFFSQWRVASYFSAALESPLTQEVLLGLVEKKENSKQNPLFFRTKEQANATQEEFGWETKWKAHLWRCNGSNPLWQVRFYKYNLSCAPL